MDNWGVKTTNIKGEYIANKGNTFVLDKSKAKMAGEYKKVVTLIQLACGM